MAITSEDWKNSKFYSRKYRTFFNTYGEFRKFDALMKQKWIKGYRSWYGGKNFPEIQDQEKRNKFYKGATYYSSRNARGTKDKINYPQRPKYNRGFGIGYEEAKNIKY